MVTWHHALCVVCIACVLGLSWLCEAQVGGRGVWRRIEQETGATREDGGGYVEGCGWKIWTEFPLAEFADIPFRKMVIGWYIGHKLFLCNKGSMVQVV